MKVETVVPAAARTISSLRDVGYDLPRAVADLVDNSIAAGATEIDVNLRFDGPDSWIRIADNGSGMDATVLVEAMRYGTERDYAADDLGKFGFGLKTASTSQCRRITVASKLASAENIIEVRRLDLAHIEKTNRWEILVVEGRDRPAHLLQPLKGHSGTVVLWEDLDRVLEYKDPFGTWAKRWMLDSAQEVDEHLAMVFHRFLVGDVENRKLSIRVNGSNVEPWDPFCRTESNTIELPTRDLRIATSTGFGVVQVRPFILPHQSQFSSDVAWRNASGPKKWNLQQGLYVYRANRLIQPGGGWNRIRLVDEHIKLARVAVDFFPDLDTALGINISKALVQLPDDLRTQLEPIVREVSTQAGSRYRSGGSAKRTKKSTERSRPSTTRREIRDSVHLERNREATSPAETVPIERGPRPVDAQGRARRAFEESADVAGETPALRKIVDALIERYPEVARALGW